MGGQRQVPAANAAREHKQTEMAATAVNREKVPAALSSTAPSDPAGSSAGSSAGSGLGPVRWGDDVAAEAVDQAD